MLSEGAIRAIDDRLVAVRLGHAAPQVVGHEDRRRAAEVLHHPHVGRDPRGQFLGGTGFGVHVTTRAQGAHEELDRRELAGGDVDDRGLLPREVDEDLLAGAVDLPHRGRQGPRPAMVVQAKLAIAIAGGLPLEVLQPEALQRHAGALELLVDPGQIRLRRGPPTTSPTRWKRRASRCPSSQSSGKGHVRPASRARRQYSDTVPRPTLHARAMARWGNCCSYFSRRISRTYLISSLSVVMSVRPSFLGGTVPDAADYQRPITAGTGDRDPRNR